MRSGFLLAAALAAVSCGPAPEPRTVQAEPPANVVPANAPSMDGEFWAYWGDEQAELAGYDFRTPRYGKSRKGVAVAIFVTETFSNRLRVKADPGNHPAADTFPVMKLNLMQDYQTGIYDYNDMTSTFVALEPVNSRLAGSPTKISFSSQEWCGQVYHQTLFDSQSIRSTRHSYFDAEADDHREISYPAEGVSEDTLFHWARGLGQPVLKPGESVKVPFLPSLQQVRQTHDGLAWTEATLSRGDQTQSIQVPAGTFEVEVWSAKPKNGPARTFYVEKEMPHRIVRWTSSADEEAVLLGSKRLQYWKMNGEGKEAALASLGLERRGARMP